MARKIGVSFSCTHGLERGYVGLVNTVSLPAAAVVCLMVSFAVAGSQPAERPCPWLAAPSTQPASRIQTSDERQDLLARGVLWQTLPSDVHAITIDRTGRAWFDLAGKASIEQIKARVERSASLRAPYVVGAKIVLHDSRGWVWLVPYDGRSVLLGYDPATRKWIKRAGSARPHGCAGVAMFNLDSLPLASSKGIAYFADEFGVHVFDGEDWSYQPLYELNIKHGLWHDSSMKYFNPLRLVQDSEGKVMAWSEWGMYGRTGTVGAFVHDGHKWRQCFIEDYKGQLDANGRALPDAERQGTDRNRLRYIAPLDGNWALVQASRWPAAILRTSERDANALQAAARDISLLGSAKYRVRRDAHDRLAELGNLVEPQLREALKSRNSEVLTRLKVLLDDLKSPGGAIVGDLRVYSFRVLGQDRRGNLWLYAQCGKASDLSVQGDEARHKIPGRLLTITPEGALQDVPGRVEYAPNFMVAGDRRVWVSCYEKGVFCLDGETVTRITGESQCIQGNIGRMWGEDAQGRIFLGNGFQTWAYHVGKPDVRKGLPVNLDSNQLMYAGMLQMDSKGGLWGLFSNELKRGGDPWRNTDAPKDVMKGSGGYWLLPLRNGAMALQLRQGQRACFFDGQRWSTHNGIKHLVESRYQDLARLIDNSRRGYDYYAKLRVDAKGRVWMVNWEKAAVFDGETWTDLVAPMKEHKIEYRHRIEVLLPLPGKDAMLAYIHGWYEVSLEGGKVQFQARLDLDGDSVSRSDRTDLWMDRLGRLFIPRERGGYTVLGEKGIHKFEHRGNPRFADRCNRVYLADGYRRVLTVIGPAGRSAAAHVEGLPEEAFICEDTRGFIWVSTRRGLVQFAVDNSPRGLALRQVALYEKGIPAARCYGMWIDSRQNLWWLGRGSDNCLLYRIELPRPATRPAQAKPVVRLE